MTISRRDFLGNAAAAATVSAASANAGPAQPRAKGPGGLPLAFDPKDPNLKYDLVVAGGTAIDPSQRLHARKDIGIKNGQIAAVADAIPASRATQVYDASGNLVTPGFVDLHCHYYHQVSRIGLPADEMMSLTATTTGVDAGDAGYSTFSGFRHHVIGQSRTRLFAFIHIASRRGSIGWTRRNRARWRVAVAESGIPHPRARVAFFAAARATTIRQSSAYRASRVRRKHGSDTE